jgi:acetyl esterase/lipase
MLSRRELGSLLSGAVVSVTLCSTAFAASDAANAPVPIESKPVLEDRYPRAQVSFADVESLPDLIYSTPPGFRPLRLDLYRLKAQPATARPLVIYIHGGGWQGGHTRHSGAFGNWPGVLASLAHRGYVVASIEYRLSGEAAFPAAIHDVKTALRWLRSNAQMFGIDRNRAVIWGGSAGGQLAALAAVTCGMPELDPPASAPMSDCVQGIVAWYGVFDFVPVLKAGGAAGASSPNNASRYLDCPATGCAADVIALASPISHLDRNDPPALLIHGDRDTTVAVEQSRQFHAALQTHGVRSTLQVIADVDHSFIGATPATTRAASLAALEATFAFIDSTIGGRL